MPRQHQHMRSVERAVPHVQRLAPSATMNALEIAYFKGKEARRLGRPESQNPFTDQHTPNDGRQSTEWTRGYEGR